MALTPESLTQGLTLRVTSQQMQRLHAAAAARGVGRHEVVRALLDQLPEPPAETPVRLRPPQASAYHRG